jgi:hypothetical protein
MPPAGKNATPQLRRKPAFPAIWSRIRRPHKELAGHSFHFVIKTQKSVV